MKQQAKIQTSLVSQKKSASDEVVPRVVIASFVIASEDTTRDLQEFRDLVLATGADIVASVSGKRAAVIARTLIGSGKLEQIKDLVILHESDLVIFNHHLTASQERNIEQHIGCRVLDRSGLILDIFARRAYTFEGKLQVELAQLEHLSTKLVRGWTHLERQKGGIGLRGPGEKQLETDRRLIRQRIQMIKKRLLKVIKQRKQSRYSRQRSHVQTVALVGYTNAGKSSLFNALTMANVQVADQLFATLDPTLRQVKFPGDIQLVLADTVGFIRDLPHDLVAAFQATLEEVCEADLLVHVVDVSHADRADLIVAVNKVLTQIGANNVPQLMVYNKIDLLPEAKARVDYDDNDMPVCAWVSMINESGLGLLREAIAECLQGRFISCEWVIPFSQAKLLAFLYQHQLVVSAQASESEGWRVQSRLSRQDYDYVKQRLNQRSNN